jgi:hypothetical protein
MMVLSNKRVLTNNNMSKTYQIQLITKTSLRIWTLKFTKKMKRTIISISIKRVLINNKHTDKIMTLKKIQMIFRKLHN